MKSRISIANLIFKKISTCVYVCVALLHFRPDFCKIQSPLGGTGTIELFWDCSKRCRAQAYQFQYVMWVTKILQWRREEWRRLLWKHNSFSNLRSHHNLSHFATFTMFRTLVIASAVLASAMAFSPASMMSRRSATKISMSAEFLPGALAPLGYFDPLGFCAGKTEGEVKVLNN